MRGLSRYSPPITSAVTYPTLPGSSWHAAEKERISCVHKNIDCMWNLQLFQSCGNVHSNQSRLVTLPYIEPSTWDATLCWIFFFSCPVCFNQCCSDSSSVYKKHPLANRKFMARVLWSLMANTHYPDRRVYVQVCRQVGRKYVWLNLERCVHAVIAVILFL